MGDVVLVNGDPEEHPGGPHGLAIVGDDEHDPVSLVTRIELVAPGHVDS